MLFDWQGVAFNIDMDFWKKTTQRPPVVWDLSMCPADLTQGVPKVRTIQYSKREFLRARGCAVPPRCVPLGTKARAHAAAAAVLTTIFIAAVQMAGRVL